MTENMKKFSEAASSNAQIQQELADLDKKLQNEVINETIIIAKKHGIELAEADFAPAEEELDLEELNAVAGGKNYCFIIGFGAGKDGASQCQLIGEGFAF